jgi:protein-tyrosine-phosphatase/predicted ATP-grasp superfamily ATP-dependent carboligase
VPVPREVVVSEARELAGLRDAFTPPLILKPPASYTLEQLDSSRLVRRADSWQAAERLLVEMLDDGPIAIQELCRGVGVGVELLLADGAPHLTFQHVRLHEPLYGGGSSYRRGVAVDRELLDAALKILGELRYTGVAMAEFKADTTSGGWALLEVNARFWGSLPLALASGADFPLALFELLVDGRREFPSSPRLGLCARNLRADAGWHVANARADRTDPTLNARPWPSVLRETAANLLAGRERSDTFTIDDPAPGFAEVGQVARELASRGWAVASSTHLRVNRRRRRRLRADARADLLRARRVLFVCKGNIARSPFAAATARRVLDGDRVVRSAGFLRGGRRPPPDAVAAAADWHVDLAGHRSISVSSELVRESDVIFVFDDRNYRVMSARFPECRGRLHLLGALDEEGPLFVPDPWGRGRDAYAAAYRRIAAALATAARP